MRPTPIPIDAYRCPVCDLKRVWSFEKAQEHADIPVDNPLPRGLIYFDNNLGGRIVAVMDAGIINHGHSYIHRTLKPAYYTNILEVIDSREFKEKLRKGEFSLGFSRLGHFGAHVLRTLKLEILVKTTPELSEIVAERKVRGRVAV